MNKHFEFLINKKISLVSFDFHQKEASIYINYNEKDTPCIKLVNCLFLVDNGIISKQLLNIYFNNKVGVLFFEKIRMIGDNPDLYKEIIFQSQHTLQGKIEIAELRAACTSYTWVL